VWIYSEVAIAVAEKKVKRAWERQSGETARWGVRGKHGEFTCQKRQRASDSSEIELIWRCLSDWKGRKRHWVREAMYEVLD